MKQHSILVNIAAAAIISALLVVTFASRQQGTALATHVSSLSRQVTLLQIDAAQKAQDQQARDAALGTALTGLESQIMSDQGVLTRKQIEELSAKLEALRPLPPKVVTVTVPTPVPVPTPVFITVTTAPSPSPTCMKILGLLGCP